MLIRPGRVCFFAVMIAASSSGCGPVEPPPLPTPPDEVLVLAPPPLEADIISCTAESDEATVVPAEPKILGEEVLPGGLPTVRGREGDRVRLTFGVRGAAGLDLTAADGFTDSTGCRAYVNMTGFHPPGTPAAADAPLGVVIEDVERVVLKKRDGVWYGQVELQLPEPTTNVKSRQAATAFVWSGRQRSGLLELAHVEVARD